MHIFPLRSVFARIRTSHFIRSVAVLGAGTVLAQLIAIAASPILTRLYTPADFGLAALFGAVVGSVTPAICGKYEVAIVVAKTVEQSRQLLGISFLVALTLSTLAFGAVWFFGMSLAGLLNAESLGEWIFVAPLAMLLTGVLTALTYYSNRLHEYRVISKSRILVTLFSVAASVTLGAGNFRYGLVLSSILATGLVGMWLLYRYRGVLEGKLLFWNSRKRVLVWRYRDFPIYNATTGLLDGVTLALPVFFLSMYFPTAVVGHYALMLRAAMAPIDFVSGAVSQVNLKKVADLVDEHRPVQPYLLRLTLMLIAIVSPLLIFVMLFAPNVFAWLFGEEWRIAGEYLQILMPALSVRFVVSTISSTFGATGNNRLGATWKITAFFVTLGVFGVAAPRVDAEGMFFTMLIIDLTLYSFYYLLAWRAAGNPLRYR